MRVFVAALNSCWQIVLWFVCFGSLEFEEKCECVGRLNFSLNDDNELRSQGGTLQLILSILSDFQNLTGFWGFGV